MIFIPGKGRPNFAGLGQPYRFRGVRIAFVEGYGIFGAMS